MRTTPAVRFVIAAVAVLCSVSTVHAQQKAEWRLGTGYLMSRPNDTKVWGFNLQREQRVGRFGVTRYVASANALGDGLFTPLLAMGGVDVGLRADLSPLSATVTVGPTLGYFVSPYRVETICQAACRQIRRGYDAGPILTATAALALGLKVSSTLRLFYEGRAHIPSGIGRSGFSGDPMAAFVEVAFGVTLLR